MSYIISKFNSLNIIRYTDTLQCRQQTLVSSQSTDSPRKSISLKPTLHFNSAITDLSFHVNISSFRMKAHLVFHWCLYNKDTFYRPFTVSVLTGFDCTYRNIWYTVKDSSGLRKK